MVKSFVSSKIHIRKSNIHGVGMFANALIEKGEVVFIKGGHILTREELFYSAVISSYLPLDDNYFLGAKNSREESGIELFVNHSCSPNCGLRGEITFIAMDRIPKGNELTIDYAMVDNEEYQFECNCRTPVCRITVTGFDWKIKELQKNIMVILRDTY